MFWPIFAFIVVSLILFTPVYLCFLILWKQWKGGAWRAMPAVMIVTAAILGLVTWGFSGNIHFLFYQKNLDDRGYKSVGSVTDSDGQDLVVFEHGDDICIGRRVDNDIPSSKCLEIPD